MDRVTYRSFLVRSWGRRSEIARLLIEEVQSGRRRELRGAQATRLVSEIEALLACAPDPLISTVHAARGSSETPGEANDG